MEEYESYTFDQNTTVAVSPSLWSHDNQTFIDPDIVRTVWVPQEAVESIGSVTAGLVILAPVDHTDQSTRSALGCAVDARWADSQSSQADGPLDIAVTANVLHRRRQYPGLLGNRFLPVEGSWSRIVATLDWLQALTPTVPYLSPEFNLSTPGSTIANLLMSTSHFQIAPIDASSNRYYDHPYDFWEFVVSTLFADGVARVGYSQQLESDTIYVDGLRPTSSMPCSGDDCAGHCRNNTASGSPNQLICGGPPPDDSNYTVMGFRGDLANSKPLPLFFFLSLFPLLFPPPKARCHAIFPQSYPFHFPNNRS